MVVCGPMEVGSLTACSRLVRCFPPVSRAPTGHPSSDPPVATPSASAATGGGLGQCRSGRRPGPGRLQEMTRVRLTHVRYIGVGTMLREPAVASLLSARLRKLLAGS